LTFHKYSLKIKKVADIYFANHTKATLFHFSVRKRGFKPQASTSMPVTGKLTKTNYRQYR
jgi:hypothetical protein